MNGTMRLTSPSMRGKMTLGSGLIHQKGREIERTASAMVACIGFGELMRWVVEGQQSVIVK